MHKSLGLRSRYNEAQLLLYAVSVASLAGFLGTALGKEPLKYAAALCQLFMLVKSISVIQRFRVFINIKPATIFLLIMGLYPFLRILLYGLSGGSFKSFTDAVLVTGAFYQLILPGFAIALLTGSTLGPLLLYRYVRLIFPIGIFLMFYAIRDTSDFNIGIGHSAMTNCFIPAAALAVYPYKRSRIIIAWISLAAILYLSSRIFSRSYSLVGIYLTLMAIAIPFKSGNKKLSFVVICVIVIAYLIGGFSFFSQESIVQDASIAEKYKLNSLMKSLNRFWSDGDFVRLFYWEGNSRADILVDAFKNFSVENWLFGRGIGASYTSFIERKTIEIHWAQETFRWGLPYTLTIIGFYIYTIRRIIREKMGRVNPMLKILGALVFVKLLDSFVFGMPQATVYNLLVYWGVMSMVIKKDLVVFDHMILSKTGKAKIAI